MLPSKDNGTEGATQDSTKMTIAERQKYLERMLGRYLHADRAGRARLLDEMEAVTGMHRKSLVRLLIRADLARRARGWQRGTTYGPRVHDAIHLIWESLDYICSERLAPALLPTAHLLGQHGELDLTDDLLGRSAPSVLQVCNGS